MSTTKFDRIIDKIRIEVEKDAKFRNLIHSIVSGGVVKRQTTKKKPQEKTNSSVDVDLIAEVMALRAASMRNNVPELVEAMRRNVSGSSSSDLSGLSEEAETLNTILDLRLSSRVHRDGVKDEVLSKMTEIFRTESFKK
jgi:hypothetical protein